MIDRETSQKILSFLEAERVHIEQDITTLIEFESPSKDKDLQEPIFKFLANRFHEMGFRTLRLEGKRWGGCAIYTPLGRKKHMPIQLLVGHIDTVWKAGSLVDMPVRRHNKKLSGPGSFDMKAGVATIIYALKALRFFDVPIPVTPVVFINSDEEVGSRESTPALQRLSKIATRALVFEPPFGITGKLKTARKGIGRFTIVCQGKPAHAGLDPGKGASAIVELSHQIQELFAMNDLERGISVNVGLVEGGVAANVVAPRSSAVIDVRVLNEKDGHEISEKIRNLKARDPDVQLTIEGRIGRPPMEHNVRNRKLWEKARKAGELLGLALEEVTAGGGSDGNTTSQYTATLDGLGTVGDGAHAQHEYIDLDYLVDRIALAAVLISMEA